MRCPHQACDLLLAHRVDAKTKTQKVHSVINRLHVAQPDKRDDTVRGRCQCTLLADDAMKCGNLNSESV